MGQKLSNIGTKKNQTKLRYTSTLTRYQAQNCAAGCSLRCLCHKSKSNRIIEVNDKLNEDNRESKGTTFIRAEPLPSRQAVDRSRSCICPDKTQFSVQ
jgi:hypothetical protein